MNSAKTTAVISALRAVNLCVKFAINIYIANMEWKTILVFSGILLTLSMSVHAVIGFGLMATVF